MVALGLLARITVNVRQDRCRDGTRLDALPPSSAATSLLQVAPAVDRRLGSGPLPAAPFVARRRRKPVWRGVLGRLLGYGERELLACGERRPDRAQHADLPVHIASESSFHGPLVRLPDFQVGGSSGNGVLLCLMLFACEAFEAFLRRRLHAHADP